VLDIFGILDTRDVSGGGCTSVFGISCHDTDTFSFFVIRDNGRNGTQYLLNATLERQQLDL
jgi:hypothetical protein